MKVNEKQRLERATLRMLVRKLILKMQVGQTQGLDSEEFAAYIFAKAMK